MKLDRRSFIKLMAMNSAATAAASLFPGISFGAWNKLDTTSGGIAWQKTPCRFCGTGCGLLVGVSGDRAVAVKGDPNCTVNKGLCCVKGYHSIQILYGKDRIQKALVRKNGKMVETPIQEALDLVASKIDETVKAHGKDAVAMYGSGQWSIADGYVASKLFKGCIGTNNVEANARLCMASAVTGFLTTFGLDEPMGCYEDIEKADVFVTWGNNMAEMHPVLFSRMLATRKNRTHVKIIDFATRTSRSSLASDRSILFRPQTDLAVANAICYEIIKNEWVNWDFVNRHVSFHKGKTNIGYGTEDHFKFKDKAETVDFANYKTFLEDYTPEKVQKISGVSAKDIKYMAARSRDLLAAASFIQTETDLGLHIGLFGSSMGGAVCLAVAGRIKPRAIVTVAAPIKSASIIPTRQNTEDTGNFPPSFYRKKLQFNITGNVSVVDNLLLFHGDADETVPVSHGREIFSLAAEPKKMIIQRNGDHRMSNPAHQREFIQETADWYQNRMAL